jgi:hypothetical protein
MVWIATAAVVAAIDGNVYDDDDVMPLLLVQKVDQTNSLDIEQQFVLMTTAMMDDGSAMLRASVMEQRA